MAEKKCVICGKSFEAGRVPNKKTCCAECSLIWKNLKSHGEHGDSKIFIKNHRCHLNGDPFRFCQTCGEQFPTPPKSTRYICPKCQAEKQKANQGMKYGDAPKPSRKCHDCGRPTWDYRCDKCKAKWKAKNKISEYATEEDNYRVAIR